MRANELARLTAGAAKAVKNGQILPSQNPHPLVRAVNEIQQALRRIARDLQTEPAPRGARLRANEALHQVLAVLAEHLDAIAAPVRHVEQAILGPHQPVHGGVLLRWRCRVHRIGVPLGIVRPLAVGAPMTLVGARRGIEYDHALVDVAVGNEQLIGLGLDVEIRRPAQVRRVVASLVHARLADRHHVLAVLRELHDVHAVARAHPHKAVMVDVDAVLLTEPGVTGAGPTPRLHEFPFCVQFEHGRRREAAIGNGRFGRRADLLLREARRHVNNPEVIAVVDEQPADVPPGPVVGQRRRPAGVDHVNWQSLGRR